MRGSPRPPGSEAQHKSCLPRNKCVEPHLETLVAELAERQHGVVTLSQLQSLGLSRSGVSRRAKVGRLHRVHSGVYAVGRRRLTRRGVWMAAVLAYGPRAVLSHRSAAALHGLRPDNRARIDVTLPAKSARARSGIDVHRSPTLSEADVTTVDGIPCTTVARTLLDLAEVAPRRILERALDQAELLKLFDPRALDDVLARADGRRGARLLRALLADRLEPTLTRSELEERFLVLCRQASLPTPAVNAWIALGAGVAYQADFLWRAEQVAIETDGRAFHSHRAAFESDRLRDQRLTLAGFTVLRFTWRQLVREPGRVSDTLRAVLAGRRPIGAR
jgi:predicted transcriptional regulator of viral defense system